MPISKRRSEDWLVGWELCLLVIGCNNNLTPKSLLIREQDLKILELRFPTSSRLPISFLLRTLALHLQVLILIPAIFLSAVNQSRRVANRLQMHVCLHVPCCHWSHALSSTAPSAWRDQSILQMSQSFEESAASWSSSVLLVLNSRINNTFIKFQVPIFRFHLKVSEHKCYMTRRETGILKRVGAINCQDEWWLKMHLTQPLR